MFALCYLLPLLNEIFFFLYMFGSLASRFHRMSQDAGGQVPLSVSDADALFPYWT